jgi:hypothetical protein
MPFIGVGAAAGVVAVPTGVAAPAAGAVVVAAGVAASLVAVCAFSGLVGGGDFGAKISAAKARISNVTPMERFFLSIKKGE